MVNKKISISTQLLALLVGLIALGGLSGCAEEKMDEATAEQIEALKSRIRPVVTLDDILGKARKDEPVQQAAPASESGVAAPGGAARSAMTLYNGACMACHSTGAAGAPMLGDKAAWEARAATGIDAMLSTARTGKGAMPPNGGSALSEAEMRQVIEYMLAEAGL